MTKILIVEDDADINNAVAEYLTARGCSCVQAFSGTEGALQWRAHRPDLVVADLMLPGMTGQQLIAALRAELRKNNVDYAVVKNTLLRRAADNVGLGELDEVLNGTTSIAISKDDPIAPMRIVNKYAKQMGDRFNIKAGFMDGKVLSLDEIMALAELPSKEVLQAQVLGTMLAPITGLAVVLKQIAEKQGAPAEEAAAEAPAAE